MRTHTSPYVVMFSAQWLGFLMHYLNGIDGRRAGLAAWAICCPSLATVGWFVFGTSFLRHPGLDFYAALAPVLVALAVALALGLRGGGDGRNGLTASAWSYAVMGVVLAAVECVAAVRCADGRSVDPAYAYTGMIGVGTLLGAITYLALLPPQNIPERGVGLVGGKLAAAAGGMLSYLMIVDRTWLWALALVTGATILIALGPSWDRLTLSRRRRLLSPDNADWTVPLTDARFAWGVGATVLAACSLLSRVLSPPELSEHAQAVAAALVAGCAASLFVPFVVGIVDADPVRTGNLKRDARRARRLAASAASSVPRGRRRGAWAGLAQAGAAALIISLGSLLTASPPRLLTMAACCAAALLPGLLRLGRLELDVGGWTRERT